VFDLSLRRPRRGLVAALVIVLTAAGCGASSTPMPTQAEASVAGSPTARAATTTPPAPTTTVAASTTPIPSIRSESPAPLQAAVGWVRPGRAMAGISSRADSFWQFEMSSAGFNLDVPGASVMRSVVSVPAAGQFQLSSIVTDGGCALGALGRYSWTLSPSGSTVTLSLINDACANRGLALPGAWVGIRCLDTSDTCLGVVDAGTHLARFLDHPLTYTVPAGWANAADYNHEFALQRATDYVKEGPDSASNITRPAIFAFNDPTPENLDSACQPFQPPSTGTIGALATWVAGRPGIQASKPTPILIDGHPALQVDLRVEAGWKNPCPAISGIALVAIGNGDFDLTSTERSRLIFVDLGSGATVLLVIDSPDSSGYDAFLAQAMPIVRAFTLARS
jgi:hypothetical protein